MAVTAVSLTFLAVFLGIFAANLVLTDVFRSDQRDVRRRLQSQMKEQQRLGARQLIRRRQESGDAGLSDLAQLALEEQESVGLWDRFAQMVAQAGMKTSPVKIVVIALSLGAGLGGVLGFLLRSPWIGLGVGLAGMSLPILYVAFRRRRRLEQLRAQLPDALDLMSRILRAGQTTVQAMNAIAEEFGPPVGLEFGFCYEQQNLGISTDVALRDLAKRTGLIEIKIFVLAVLVHRQAGGNLTELLDKLANMVRERFRMRREIKSLTAEGRAQAVVLIALPIVIWVVLSLLNPTYAFRLLDHPTMIIVTLVMMFLGAVWINRIVNFDF